MTSFRLPFLSISTLLLALLFTASPATAQPVTPSVYTGLGTGTNLGGLVGVGADVRVGDYVSINAAFGAVPNALGADVRGPSPVDFDLGVKVYPFRTWLFAGVNYGLIDAETTTRVDVYSRIGPLPADRSQEVTSLTKTRGFTFSLGARTPTWNHLYASAYVGVTSNADVNYLNVLGSDPDPDFFPRLGLMIGVEIW